MAHNALLRLHWFVCVCGCVWTGPCSVTLVLALVFVPKLPCELMLVFPHSIRQHNHPGAQEQLSTTKAALRDAKRQLDNVSRPKRRYDQVSEPQQGEPGPFEGWAAAKQRVRIAALTKQLKVWCWDALCVVLGCSLCVPVAGLALPFFP